jgi:putative ABC transport system permease protein
MSGARPPRIAEWLARRAAPPSDADLIAGDFREEFDERALRLGIAAARRWYWSETLRSLFPLAARRWTVPNRSRPTSDGSDVMLASVIDDVRYAARLARRTPLASFAVVATMVLGIGSTTAVFSAMNAILLKPLPFPESARVVRLTGVVRGDLEIESLAYPDLMDFRRTVPDFSDITLYQRQDQTLQHGDDPQLLHVIQVDENYPRVFGTRVALGRWLGPGDVALNAPKVVLLSHDFWQREFGGDRAIVGQTISLDNESVQVIGVLAADAYTYPTPGADALAPLIITPNTPMTNRGSMWAGAAARLKTSANLEQARRDLAATAKEISTEFPNSNLGISARLLPLHDAVVGSVQSMLKLLATAVAAVLLIACINIANLILGRAQTRSREFAVRSALGGSPVRVRQQVLTESLVLASVGGVLGVAIAPLLTRALIAVYPDMMPRAEEIGVDARVLVVAALATMIAGVLSALPTARRAGRLDLVHDLRDGIRSGWGRRDRRVGRVLIVTQVAASLALLFGAGLLLQTFWRLTQVRPGFDARNTTTFHVFAPVAHYAASARYYDEATDALRAIPGVREVASASMVPFAGGHFVDTYVQQELGDQGPRNPQSIVAFVSPGHERALGLPVTRGRSFTVADDSTSEPVVVINEALAKRYYPATNPIGHIIDWNRKNWRIVGVVASTYLDNLWEDAPLILYASTRQAPRRSRYFIVRSDLPSNQVLVAARAALRRIDGTIALTDASTMEQRVEASLGPQRFRAALMASLGGLALVLAVIGIYGVVAHTVTRRTREIGIRMALGEAAHEVRRRVVGDALRVASVGIVAGVGLALIAGQSLTVFLVNVSPYDARLLGGAVLVLTAVVSAAAYGPARRAARVDPVTALRAD